MKVAQYDTKFHPQPFKNLEIRKLGLKKSKGRIHVGNSLD